MVSTDLVMFAVQGTVAVLLLTGSAQIWHLVVLQLVRGTASAFFFPASSGLVPHVVSPERLQQANALLRLSQSSVGIVGAALSGLAVAAVGSGPALAFDAATFLVSAALLARIRLPAAVKAESRSFLGELREGWDEFRSRSWLWSIVVQFMFINAFGQGAFLVLGPVVAQRELGGAWAWGAIVAGMAAGEVLGGLVVLRMRPSRILLVASFAILLFAPVCFLLAIPAPVVVLVGASAVAGIGVQIFGVFWDTAMQQQIPHDRLSRVYSYDALGSYVCIPIGLSIAGPVADLVGVGTALVLAGGVVIVATALVLLVDEVRTLRRTDVAPAPA
jgi:predicted MFS family arabinose efflux permease